MFINYDSLSVTSNTAVHLVVEFWSMTDHTYNSWTIEPRCEVDYTIEVYVNTPMMFA